MSDSNPFGVRRPTHQDFEPLMLVVLELVHEDALVPINEQKIVDMVSRCIERDGAIAGVIDGPDGSIEGTIGLVLDQHWYSSHDHLEARWLGTTAAYQQRIKKDKRQLGMGTALIRFAKWAAEQMNVPLHLSLLTTSNLASKMISYQRQAPQIGAMFGYGDLPDRDFLDQTPKLGVKDSAAGLSRSLASGQGQSASPAAGDVVQSARASVLPSRERATTG